MKLKRRIQFSAKLKKNFNEVDIPDKLFDDMNEGDKKLIEWKKMDMMLEIYKGDHYAKYITGWESFSDEPRLSKNR